MQIRRVLTDGGTLQTETRGADDQPWQSSTAVEALGYASPFRPEWEGASAAAQGARSGDEVLPFEPLSFRDFMVFEGHFTAAGRGWTHRFRPGVAAFTDAYERVTRRTFPAYRPKPLFYRQPIYYMSNARTFVPSGTEVAFPPYSTALDWELELGFVLRAPLQDASPDEAERAIGAFVVLNDFSARDVQITEQDEGFGPAKAKHFLSSTSATAVSADVVLGRWTSLRATVTLNGEVVSRPDASRPQWNLGEILAHASSGERLQPGELFGTGTFVGGSGMEIRCWLQPGDLLRLQIDGIGHVEHRIVERVS